MPSSAIPHLASAFVAALAASTVALGQRGNALTVPPVHVASKAQSFSAPFGEEPASRLNAFLLPADSFSRKRFYTSAGIAAA